MISTSILGVSLLSDISAQYAYINLSAAARRYYISPKQKPIYQGVCLYANLKAVEHQKKMACYLQNFNYKLHPWNVVGNSCINTLYKHQSNKSTKKMSPVCIIIILSHPNFTVLSIQKYNKFPRCANLYSTNISCSKY